jgi:hypothetical protein
VGTPTPPNVQESQSRWPLRLLPAPYAATAAAGARPVLAEGVPLGVAIGGDRSRDITQLPPHGVRKFANKA